MALANVSKLVKQDEFGRLMAPYATNWQESKGRKYEETKASDRSPFQRDRDRIIHSDAFRRLQYKTQVFTNTEEGDFRTRLTHSLEVAQLSRSICRALGLDEDLGEVVALAHDLGHPPFGHAGEEALHECMKDYGGFYHNLQTIKLVREIECRYGGFDGLNLSWESLEGIAKHNGPMEEWEADDPLVQDLDPAKWCGLEGQVAAACDDLAYNHHDIDDGLRAGLFTLEDLKKITSFNNAIKKNKISLNNYGINRFLINYLVTDLIEETNKRIKKNKIKTIKDVYKYGKNLVSFSKKTEFFLMEIRNFLKGNMYNHKFITIWNIKSEDIVEQLFNYYLKNYDKIKEKHESQSKERNICDFIAGMTDKYALTIYNDLIK
mgnify:CR=1 FL=1